MKKFAVAFLFLSTAVFISSFSLMDNTGVAGKTGSPGETYCTGCHSGTALNGGGGSVVISPVIGTYVLGQTYTLNVTVTQTGRSLFGFALEALTPTNTNAGTLIVTNSSQTHILTAGSGRKNMVHQFNAGASADSHTFTFNWTAPLTNVGNVKLFAVGNAVNGNNLTSGDLVYSTNQIILAPALGVASNDPSFINVNVFPNPVTADLNISYFLNKSTTVSATLFTIDGKNSYALFSEEQDNGSQTKQIILDPSIAPGIYFLEVKADGKSTIQKVVVL